jgi:hypothetical protein
MADATTVIANLGHIFAPAQYVIDRITFVVGLAVAGYGAWTFGRQSRNSSGGQNSPYKGAAITVAIGSILMSIHYFMNGMTVSSFGSGSAATALSYDATSGKDAATLIVHWVLDFAALAGWIFALVGWFLIHRSGHPNRAQPGDFGKGATRLIGAWGCCNLLLLTNAVAATGGFSNPLAQ